jgi:hypothetical protein
MSLTIWKLCRNWGKKFVVILEIIIVIRVKKKCRILEKNAVK